MAQLRHDYDEFRTRKAEILVVGPERASAFEKYWKQHELPFVGLPDPTHRVLTLFGQEVSIFKLGRMPAQVIVDSAGGIRHVQYGASMKDIPENEALFSILDTLNKEG